MLHQGVLDTNILRKKSFFNEKISFLCTKANKKLNWDSHIALSAILKRFFKKYVA